MAMRCFISTGTTSMYQARSAVSAGKPTREGIRMRYKDKTAVITGGGTGIGAAVARRLASEGASLALIGRRREPLEAIAADTGAMIVQADAADRVAMAEATAGIVEWFGGIDVLVANAGGH